MHRNETNLSTKLQRIEELAEKDQNMRFTSLAHLLNPEMLRTSFKKLNQHGAAGVDGITVKEYREYLGINTEALHKELKSGKYRATSVRRVYIPKADGKLRPLGIPTVKDRVLQRAVGDIISKIYEPYFIENSYGFRPKRSCHDAINALKKAARSKRSNYVVEADIKSYFDTVNHDWMMKFLSHRIADKQILRLVKKWLNAGAITKREHLKVDQSALCLRIFTFTMFWIYGLRRDLRKAARGERNSYVTRTTLWYALKRKKKLNAL